MGKVHLYYPNDDPMVRLSTSKSLHDFGDRWDETIGPLDPILTLWTTIENLRRILLDTYSRTDVKPIVANISEYIL